MNDNTYGKLVKRLRSHDGWALNQTLDEAANAIEELTAELEYIKRQYDLAVEDLEKIGWGEWIPVTERLPEEHEIVLVCNAEYGRSGLGFATVAVWDGTYWIEIWDRRTALHRISHWMPLPEPPKEERKDADS